MHIRAATDFDWPAIWQILEPVIRAGDTYTFAPDLSEADARAAWMHQPSATFVACLDKAEHSGREALLGTYFIKPNQPGNAAHVCNCGYVTAGSATGRGVAAAMCAHSQAEALARGFRAMQFNFVVSSNERAVRLWHRLGFATVGTLPGAFRHPARGFIDAFVMFKTLVR